LLPLDLCRLGEDTIPPPSLPLPAKTLRTRFVHYELYVMVVSALYIVLYISNMDHCEHGKPVSRSMKRLKHTQEL
jgi:hypothetical protein